MQERVGDHVLDDHFSRRFGRFHRAVGRFGALFLFDRIILTRGKGLFRELRLGYVVTPVFEAAFGEFHDVAFVDERDRR